MWIVLSVFLLLSLRPALEAQAAVRAGADESRIVALENAWNQAVQQKDIKGLDLLLGEELVYIDYDGKLMDKAEYLASVKSPSLRASRIVSESMSVHFFGTVAMVNGVYRENGVTKGKPYALRERFTDLWTRRKESWVCVASQSTLIGQLRAAP